MTSHPRRTRLRVDGDGVRILEAPGLRRTVWLLALSTAVVGVAVVVAVAVLRAAPPRSPDARAESPATPPDVLATTASKPPAAAPVSAPAEPAPATPRIRAVPRAEHAPSPPPAPGANEPPPEKEAPMFEVSNSPDRPGIAVFPPPGTKPIKSGIIVPDDFPLPPGYVRHYQATDDGERLPAILMFHPDYQFVDEHGQPVAIPADRIVPPDMAPPGLPVKMLEVPKAPGAPDRPR
jgi:hypothetical protein